jgi:hypothetical protein
MRPFKAHKFGAVRTNGYASKREADYAAQLDMRKRALNGDIVDWLEQVPVRLPGGVKHVIDFMLMMRDGSVQFVEVKGMETQAWRNKVKQLRELRPEVFKKLIIVK